MGVLVVALVLLAIVAQREPSVRFIRFDVDDEGKTIAVCAVTNRSFLPIAVYGFQPDQPAFFVRSVSTGTDLGGYACCTGMEYHRLGLFETRIVGIPFAKAPQGVRVGILYGSPSEIAREIHWRVQSMFSPSSEQIAWTDEITR